MPSRHGGQGSNLDLLPVQQKHFDIETSKPLLFIRQLRRIKFLLIPALPFAYLCPAQDDCRGCCHMVSVFTSNKKKSYYCIIVRRRPPGYQRASGESAGWPVARSESDRGYPHSESGREKARLGRQARCGLTGVPAVLRRLRATAAAAACASLGPRPHLRRSSEPARMLRILAALGTSSFQVCGGTYRPQKSRRRPEYCSDPRPAPRVSQLTLSHSRRICSA